MATFKLRANELSGQTGLTVRIYALGSSVIANGTGGDALTETASSDGQFTATIAETLAGAHEFFVYKSGSPIYRGMLNADGAVLIADEPTITASDPGKRTGYLVCYDSNGDRESGVSVSMVCVYAPETGLALDSLARTDISGVDGVVSFVNLIVGAKYRYSRQGGESRSIVVSEGVEPIALDSVVGE